MNCDLRAVENLLFDGQFPYCTVVENDGLSRSSTMENTHVDGAVCTPTMRIGGGYGLRESVEELKTLVSVGMIIGIIRSVKKYTEYAAVVHENGSVLSATRISGFNVIEGPDQTYLPSH